MREIADVLGTAVDYFVGGDLNLAGEETIPSGHCYTREESCGGGADPVAKGAIALDQRARAGNGARSSGTLCPPGAPPACARCPGSSPATSPLPAPRRTNATRIRAASARRGQRSEN